MEQNINIMKAKTFIVASISATISMFILAGLWHELINAAFYANEGHTAHRGTGIIFLAYLVLSVLMVYIYTKSVKKRQSWLSNLMYGMLMGLLWVFPHDLAMAGAHDTSIMYVFKNAFWHMAEQGFGGVIIGILYAKMLLK